MTPTKEEIIAFLAQRPMFEGLPETDLARIADKLEPFTLEAGKPVFSHGDRGTVFYLIFSGRVRMWRSEQKREVELGDLESGDLFGEEALLFSRPRPYAITTLEDCFFLSMHRGAFNWMLNRYPDIKEYLETIARTRQQARSLAFDWLQRGEVVYLMTRRHPAELGIALLRPAVALVVGGIFLYLAAMMGAVNSLKTIGYGVATTLMVISVLWSIWEYLDWQNDYFFITNQRVVWVEQVILQSASRQEAPLAAIQSVDVSTSQLGRIFGFGDVFVRTFTGTGSLTLTSIDHPKRFKKEIEELLIRVRHKQTETADQRVRQSVRQTLGLETAEVEDTVLHVVEPEQQQRSSFLNTREVQGETITYHKHWWVLLSKTWIWILALVADIGFMVYLAVNQFAAFGYQFPVNSSVFVGALGAFLFMLIAAYHYLDWKNDIYQLTSEMLIDSEKKPLGREVSRSAPLKNIISLEHQRKGFLHLILNYGNVKVVVADESLIFYDVGNPALIQQDIYYRQEQLKLKQEEEDMERDREHITKWLQAYHEAIQSETPPAPEDSENMG